MLSTPGGGHTQRETLKDVAGKCSAGSVVCVCVCVGWGGCVHLKQDICAHGLSMSDDWLLVLSFPIPAVQLYTPEIMKSTDQWTCIVTYNPHLSNGLCVSPPSTCILTVEPGDTSPRRTSLQTVGPSGRCCGRSWWSNGPAVGPSPGTTPAGPSKLERFHLTSGTDRTRHWTFDLEQRG